MGVLRADVSNPCHFCACFGDVGNACSRAVCKKRQAKIPAGAGAGFFFGHPCTPYGVARRAAFAVFQCQRVFVIPVQPVGRGSCLAAVFFAIFSYGCLSVEI